MRQPTWGPIVQQRVKGFLQALLVYAEKPDREVDFLYRWEQMDSPSETIRDRPKLAIATNRRFLQRISNLSQNQVYEAIKILKSLDILDDNRTQTQGKEEWRFTLKLWSYNSTSNLIVFDREWDSRKPSQSKNTDVASPKAIAPYFDKQNTFSLAVSLGYGTCIPRVLPQPLAS